MKVLVTGATGFIGNYVIEELLKRRISLITNSTLSQERIQQTWLNKVEYVQANLNEKKENWFSFFKKPDMLIHLAWEKLPNYKESFHLEENLPNNIFSVGNMLALKIAAIIHKIIREISEKYAIP